MTNLVQLAGILLDVTASSREEAVTLCGQTLERIGSVSNDYISAMWEREQIFSSYVGREVAIPHGTDASREYVKHAQVVMLRFATPIDWDGEEVKLCFGIASKGDEHGAILANVAELLMDDDDYERLIASNDKEEILQLLNRESEN